MANINICAPSACYSVEKILEISHGQGNHKTYKVQWAPSWVSEVHLMGCDALIQQYLGQKESIVDPFKDTHDEVKQEVELTEIESAHEKINIFTVGVQGDCAQSEGHEEHMVCDGIKVEEEDSSTGSPQVVNQEITEVQNAAAFGDIEGHHEIHSSSSKNDSLIDNQNESYVSTRFNDNHHEEKPNMDIEIVLEYPASENVVARTKDKRLVSNDTNIDFVNAKSTAALLQKNMQNMAKERQNIESSLTKNTQPILQHPSKNLVNSTVLLSSISHRKASYVSTSNDSSISSTSTTIPNIRTYSSSNPALTTGNSGRILQNTIGSDIETCSRTLCTMNAVDSSFEHPDVNYSADKSNTKGSILLALDPTNSYPMNSRDSLKYGKSSVQSDVRSGSIDFHGSSVVSSNQVFKDCRHILQKTIKLSSRDNCASTTNNDCNTYRNLSDFNADRAVSSKTSEANNCDCDNCIKQGQLVPADIPKLSCAHCTKTFICYTQKIQHEKVHSEELPFQCEHCMKKFKFSCNLKTHVRRIHTRERPHKCTFCTKRFATTCDLKKHLRVHDDERPYECFHCSKRFKMRNTLLYHNKRCRLVRLSSI